MALRNNAAVTKWPKTNFEYGVSIIDLIADGYRFEDSPLV